jgi:RNA polymerase sigma-70 factor (ECF subfamily)
LTQSFFAFLLEKESVRTVDGQKGKFRSFPLASLTNFLNNEWDKRRTLKRGGQHQIVPLPQDGAELRYQQEALDWLTPEKLFERRWALTLLSEVLDRLKQEYMSAQKESLFSRLEPALTQVPNEGLCAECAAALGMKEGAVKVALHRMRRRFGDLLRSEIAHTVTSPEEIDEEIRQLFAAISR